jgi:ribosome maturation factor RimP
MDIVKERTGLEKKFWTLAQEVVRAQQLELYDLEYLPGQHLLRLYIMHPETKSADIQDCVKVDHALTPYFESETWMPEEVTLEVGSPGVYRHVSCLAHFQMGLGEMHAVTIMGNLDETLNPGVPKKIMGNKKLRGKLIEVKPDSITLAVEGFNVLIRLATIKKAQVDPDFEELLSKANNNVSPNGLES